MGTSPLLLSQTLPNALAIALASSVLIGTSTLVAQEHPSAAYEAVLAEVQQEFPDRGLVLMNRHVDEGTDTEIQPDSLRHPRDWIDDLQSRSLIVGSCVVPENVIGCIDELSVESSRPTIELALFPLEIDARARPVVRVTFLRSTEDGQTYLQQIAYTLKESDGHWEVVSRRVTGVS